MKRRGATRLAVILWAIFVACWAAALLLSVVNDLPGPPRILAVAGIALPTVGAVVVSRRPGNPIGWILLAYGLLRGFGSFTGEYAAYTLHTDPGSLPAGVFAAWLASWLPWTEFVLLAFLFLLFPTGRLTSPRWRWFAWVVVVTQVSSLLVFAFATESIEADAYKVDNPVGIPGLGFAADSMFEIGLIAIPVVIGGAVLSLISRYLRAGREERLQIKWVAWAAAFGAFWLAFDGLVIERLDLDSRFFAENLFQVAIVVLLPVAIGLGVLKYRLYEVDRLISRTVSYGLLTGLLVAVYLGVVFALQQLVSSAAGDSQLAVAGATLAVAALFRPARRRIQGAVDRRFNRARYDARRTVESFATRLRNEVDLDDVSSDLVATVQASVQPDAASLWLRPSGTQRPRHGLRG